MKTNIFAIALTIGLLFGSNAKAETAGNSAAVENNSEKVSLRVPNFVRPLAEKLISEYKKQNSNVEFEFVSAKSQNAENAVQFTTGGNDIAFARYAVLPVTTKDSEASQLLGSRRLNSKKLKSLLFVKDELDEDQKESKAEQALHIYTGNSQQSVSRAYASHFSHEVADYKGKKISGDDSFLNTAISRDPLGVTINSLSNIYDLKSRHVKQELSIVPLDVDKQGKQVLSEGSLDELIALLEKEEIDEIPVANVGLAYNHGNSAASRFVRWILTDGTQYVHEYGLLQLSQKELSAQVKRTQETSENSNVLACL